VRGGRLHGTAIWLGVLVLFFTGTAGAAQKYLIKDIGAIGPGVFVEGMNNAGQIVGAMPAGGSTFRAWFFDGGKVVDLNTCGGLGCRAMDINSLGQIVGNIGRDPYVYSHGKFIDIAAFARPQGVAVSINDISEVVGWYTLIPVAGEHFPAERHAFFYRGRKLVDLGTLGGLESAATSVNNAGQVVGYSMTYTGESHAFLYANDRMLDLGTLGGATSRANSINDEGRVVGTAAVTGGKTQHAFLYADGKMADLGSLNGADSQALSINNSGHIVGTSGGRGFLYSQAKMVDLMTVLPSHTLWKSLVPRCINDKGQIAGTGTTVDGETHVFLMSLVP